MKKFSFTSFWLILLVATSHASITLSGTFVTNAEDLDGSALSDDRLGLVVVDTSTTDPNASGSFAAATQGGLLSGASLDIGKTFGSSSNIMLPVLYHLYSHGEANGIDLTDLGDASDKIMIKKLPYSSDSEHDKCPDAKAEMTCGRHFMMLWRTAGVTRRKIDVEI